MKFYNVTEIPTSESPEGTYYVKTNDKVDTYLVTSGEVKWIGGDSGVTQDDLAKKSNNLIGEFTYNGNREIYPTAFDETTGIWTAQNHELVTGDIIQYALNTNVDPVNVTSLPNPITLNVRKVEVIDENTFKLVTNDAELTPIEYVENPNFNLSNFHLEVLTGGITQMSVEFEDRYDVRLVFVGKTSKTNSAVRNQLDINNSIFGYLWNKLEQPTTFYTNWRNVLSWQQTSMLFLTHELKVDVRENIVLAEEEYYSLSHTTDPNGNLEYKNIKEKGFTHSKRIVNKPINKASFRVSYGFIMNGSSLKVYKL